MYLCAVDQFDRLEWIVESAPTWSPKHISDRLLFAVVFFQQAIPASVELLALQVWVVLAVIILWLMRINPDFLVLADCGKTRVETFLVCFSDYLSHGGGLHSKGCDWRLADLKYLCLPLLMCEFKDRYGSIAAAGEQLEARRRPLDPVDWSLVLFMVCNLPPPLLGLLEDGYFVFKWSDSNQVSVLGFGPGYSPDGGLISSLINIVRSELAHLFEVLGISGVNLHESFRVRYCKIAARRRVLEVSLHDSTITMVAFGVASKVSASSTDIFR